MSGYIHWAVLAPGEPAWLERQARAALCLDDEEEDWAVELPFTIAPGGSHYHALIGREDTGVGDEVIIAKHLSRVCAEPVYSIEQASPPPIVYEFRNGVDETLDVAPRELAQSLGCPLPKPEQPPEREARRPLQQAALAEGVLWQEALPQLEEECGHPLPPGRYRFEDTPKGLIITGGTGDLGFAAITLSERFPLATVYSVTATPSLDIFIVRVRRRGETLVEFAHPPDYRATLERPVTEIIGERTPERILAALGIPAEWFR